MRRIGPAEIDTSLLAEATNRRARPWCPPSPGRSRAKRSRGSWHATHTVSICHAFADLVAASCEPAHVHVDRDDSTAKVWLRPVSLAWASGFADHELRRVLRLVEDHVQEMSGHGMSTTDRQGEQVGDVRFEDDRMSVDLADGRTITVPLSWYPRLEKASPAQRGNWRIAGGGFGIHWPDLDEDLSTAGLLRGARAPGVAPGALRR